KELKVSWTQPEGLPGSDNLDSHVRNSALDRDETIVNKGDVPAALSGAAKQLTATYVWPCQSHASLGPSCAVADVRADAATIWTASQGMHDNRVTFARFLGLPENAVRLIYLEGSGCYGMNGHEDAAADAAIISRAVGRPVRV